MLQLRELEHAHAGLSWGQKAPADPQPGQKTRLDLPRPPLGSAASWPHYQGPYGQNADDCVEKAEPFH
eukprot:NODE_11566_length_405_cov_4.033708_g10429_i0.p4 GENE.NODE_11566_length_405_cov_4.033708_g10429_i0~~NODE_11566_length_405_cov_4.033708_g10429_i0.p4  ORF type:complete len:68 (+),score=7.67 NODE_11566_length_405_cov_4.033708_g10429_i0:103-306(+)